MPILVILVSAGFGFIVRTDRQTDTHTHRHHRMTDAAERLSHATVVGVSNGDDGGGGNYLVL